MPVQKTNPDGSTGLGGVYKIDGLCTKSVWNVDGRKHIWGGGHLYLLLIYTSVF